MVKHLKTISFYFWIILKGVLYLILHSLVTFGPLLAIIKIRNYLPPVYDKWIGIPAIVITSIWGVAAIIYYIGKMVTWEPEDKEDENKEGEKNNG